MRFLGYLFLLPILLFGEVCGVERPCKKIIDYIFEKLPESGVLKQDKHGFVYVDVTDDYIHKLVGLIEDGGYVEPDYFIGEDRHGAHISVIYAGEAERYRIGKVEEVGSTIYFRAKNCLIVQPETNPAIDSYYIVAVDCPILAKIRKKYGLPANKYPFHITIGVKNVPLSEEVGEPDALDEAM